MLLSDTVISAVIAGIVSLLVSGIAYFGTRRRIASERERLEKELGHKFTERLYDLRLEHYPKAFEITEMLGKTKGISEKDIYQIYCTINEELRKWKSGEVHLILSNNALQIYYELEDMLKKNPEKGTVYSQIQIDKIWRLRNKFRGALRCDVGSLFEEEPL